MRIALPLLMAAGLALGLAFRRPSGTPEAAASLPPVSAAAPVPIVPPPANDVRLLALACVEGRAPEAEAALRARLRAEPLLWGDVLDVLCSIDAPEAGRVAGALAGDVDVEGEARAIDLLRSGPSAHGRRMALAVLKKRESAASLGALIEAARTDVDRMVRYEALQALSFRKGRAGSEAEALAIQDVLLGRARGEADVELRTLATRLSGQAAEGDVARPAPPSRKSRLSPRRS